ncbi:hypothetical protein B0H17DRAFT_1177869 [Mycena rosella]|uniref:Uncharacterized protein n=1 Tax=Mycena rosella TaxID=1033263 RepID=A0AAD7DSS9_MYCRO|nr:hypothetical protein B0H17DRAFT_1177869 [Mycena rosella]
MGVDKVFGLRQRNHIKFGFRRFGPVPAVQCSIILLQASALLLPHPVPSSTAVDASLEKLIKIPTTGNSSKTLDSVSILTKTDGSQAFRSFASFFSLSRLKTLLDSPRDTEGLSAMPSLRIGILTIRKATGYIGGTIMFLLGQVTSFCRAGKLAIIGKSPNPTEEDFLPQLFQAIPLSAEDRLMHSGSRSIIKYMTMYMYDKNKSDLTTPWPRRAGREPTNIVPCRSRNYLSSIRWLNTPF